VAQAGVLISQRCLPGRTAIRVRELKDVGFADDVFRSFLESHLAQINAQYTCTDLLGPGQCLGGQGRGAGFVRIGY
jgi:hypothetical protein